MFQVNEYRIVFKRVWHYTPFDNDGPIRRTGRYDTKCEIYCKDETGKSYWSIPTFTGIAKLHPNDKPDKIVGKKIVLRNVLSVRGWPGREFRSKEVRTAIWKAFWGWIDQWSNQPGDRVHHVEQALKGQ